MILSVWAHLMATCSTFPSITAPQKHVHDSAPAALNDMKLMKDIVNTIQSDQSGFK